MCVYWPIDFILQIQGQLQILRDSFADVCNYNAQRSFDLNWKMHTNEHRHKYNNKKNKQADVVCFHGIYYLNECRMPRWWLKIANPRLLTDIIRQSVYTQNTNMYATMYMGVCACVYTCVALFPLQRQTKTRQWQMLRVEKDNNKKQQRQSEYLCGSVCVCVCECLQWEREIKILKEMRIF